MLRRAMAGAIGRGRKTRTLGRKTMTGKEGTKNYFKGTGGTKEGRHTRKGRFIVDVNRRKFIFPPSAIEDTPFKPYVARNSPKYPPAASESE